MSESFAPPAARQSVFSWLRARFFSGWLSALTTLAILYLAWQFIPDLVQWAFFHAVWSPENPRLCRDAAAHGACWAFIADKHRFILFGTYPVAEQWRPAAVIVLLIGLWTLTALRFAVLAAPCRLLVHGFGSHRRAHVGRRIRHELRRE